MSIPGIEAIGASVTDSLSGINATYGAQPTATGYLTTGVSASSESNFSNILTNSVNTVQSTQDTAADLAVKAVTGDLDDIHDYTIAAAEAKTTLELTAAVRNKAVDAFNEIMRMQV